VGPGRPTTRVLCHLTTSAWRSPRRSERALAAQLPAGRSTSKMPLEYTGCRGCQSALATEWPCARMTKEIEAELRRGDAVTGDRAEERCRCASIYPARGTNSKKGADAADAQGAGGKKNSPHPPPPVKKPPGPPPAPGKPRGKKREGPPPLWPAQRAGQRSRRKR